MLMECYECGYDVLEDYSLAFKSECGGYIVYFCAKCLVEYKQYIQPTNIE